MTQGPLARLYKQLQDGDISRRDFLQKATVCGASAGMAVFLANAQAIAAQGGSKNGFALPSASMA